MVIDTELLAPSRQMWRVCTASFANLTSVPARVRTAAHEAGADFSASVNDALMRYTQLHAVHPCAVAVNAISPIGCASLSADGVDARHWCRAAARAQRGRRRSFE